MYKSIDCQLAPQLTQVITTYKSQVRKVSKVKKQQNEEIQKKADQQERKAP